MAEGGRHKFPTEMLTLARVGVVSGLVVIALYLISPTDASQGIPSPYASRYLWTPAIPFLVGLSVCCSVMAGLNGELTRGETIGHILLVFSLIILSPQFAEFSPIEADGWWFLQIGMRFSEFGSDGTQSYLSHMLVLLPLDLVTRVIPGYEPFFASILGVLMFSGWLYLCSRIVISESSTLRFHVPVYTFFALLMISWWSPTPYSAQMLALFLMTVLLYTNPGEDIEAWKYYAIAVILPISHIQISIATCLIMLVDSIISVSRARTSQICGYVVGLSFFLWNFTFGSGPFLAQFPDQTPIPITLSFFLSALTVGYLLAWLVNNYLTKDSDSKAFKTLERIDHLLGTSNVAVLIGCIMLSPLLLLVDFRINAARLTPRIIVYCLVPFTFWMAKGLEFAHQRLESIVPSKEVFRAAIIAFSIICGSLASIGHANYVQRTVLIPHESIDCWEMTEEEGLRGLMMDISGQPRYVIHSPVFLPNADAQNFWYFVSLGDESSLPTVNEEFLSAVLETSDMEDKDWERVGMDPGIFENWTLVGEVPGACRLWVHPEDVQFMDPTLYWDRR